MPYNSTLPPRKKPMPRASKPMKRAPLAKMSAKAKANVTPRRKCLAIVRGRNGGFCEFPGCVAAMRDGHERLARSQGGSSTDPANVIGLCRRHHEWVTENMNKARKMGLAI
jgi:hypothetical protein